MEEAGFQQMLLRTFGLVISPRVAAGLARVRAAGYVGLVAVEGRDVQTGLPREVALALDQPAPPDGDTPVMA